MRDVAGARCKGKAGDWTFVACFVALLMTTGAGFASRFVKKDAPVGASLLSPTIDRLPQLDGPRVKPVVTHLIPFPGAAAAPMKPVSTPPSGFPVPKRVKPVSVKADGSIVGDE